MGARLRLCPQNDVRRLGWVAQLLSRALILQQLTDAAQQTVQHSELPTKTAVLAELSRLSEGLRAASATIPSPAWNNSAAADKLLGIADPAREALDDVQGS